MATELVFAARRRVDEARFGEAKARRRGRSGSVDDFHLVAVADDRLACAAVVARLDDRVGRTDPRPFGRDFLHVVALVACNESFGFTLPGGFGPP